MKFSVPITSAELQNWLRKKGYHPAENKVGVTNFSRRVMPYQPFPKFHIYFNSLTDGTELDLHLDQKAETRHYQATHAHNAEYDGPLLEQEKQRLLS